MTKRKPLPEIAQCEAIGKTFLNWDNDCAGMKPCPICGADAIASSSTIVTDQDTPVHWVQCVAPDCAMAGPYCKTQEEAVQIWNTIELSVDNDD